MRFFYMIIFRYAVLTHQGKVRENNEDNFYVDDFWRKDVTVNVAARKGVIRDGYLLASVCDGMGGQDLGETASLLAVESLHDFFGRPEEEDAEEQGQSGSEKSEGILGFFKDLFGGKKADDESVQEPAEVPAEIPSHSNYLRDDPMEYVNYANDRICQEMREQKKSIGTTFAAVEFCEGSAVTVNLGDSPVFLFSQGRLKELSVEHSPVGGLIRDGLITREEAKVHPLRNKISQYLGIFPDYMILVPAVSEKIPLKPHDQYLLCSDGLTNMADETEIIDILSLDSSPEEKVRKLVQLAVDHGGKDNITALLVEIAEEDEEAGA